MTSIDFVTFPVQTTINAIAFLVEAAVYAIAFLVEAAVYAIAFLVEPFRQTVSPSIRCAVRLSIKPTIDTITFFIQAVVYTISLSVKPVFDAVAAIVQSVFNAIALIGKNTAAENCGNKYEQRDDCHVANVPDFHIRTPCMHMIWPLLLSQRDPAAMVDNG